MLFWWKVDGIQKRIAPFTLLKMFFTFRNSFSFSVNFSILIILGFFCCSDKITTRNRYVLIVNIVVVVVVVVVVVADLKSL